MKRSSIFGNPSPSPHEVRLICFFCFEKFPFSLGWILRKFSNTKSTKKWAQKSKTNTHKEIRDRNVLMVGPNFRVGKKIGCGNFGELRLGKFYFWLLWRHFLSITSVLYIKHVALIFVQIRGHWLTMSLLNKTTKINLINYNVIAFR